MGGAQSRPWFLRAALREQGDLVAAATLPESAIASQHQLCSVRQRRSKTTHAVDLSPESAGRGVLGGGREGAGT